MKDVAGLMHLAYKLAHELSDACFDMEQEPGLRDHPAHATLIADGGVSALAHVAAASADLSDWSLGGRARVTESLRGARQELQTVRQRLHSLQSLRYVPETTTALLAERIDELSVILTALAVAVRGNHLAA